MPVKLEAFFEHCISFFFTEILHNRLKKVLVLLFNIRVEINKVLKLARYQAYRLFISALEFIVTCRNYHRIIKAAIGTISLCFITTPAITLRSLPAL